MKKNISAVATSIPAILPLAKKAYELSISDYSEASACIIFSAMGIEGFINELEFWCNSAPRNLSQKEKILGIVLTEMENMKASLKVKLQQIFYALTGKIIDKGSIFYQDFNLLVDIRNNIIHRKPEPILYRKKNDPIIPHKLVQRVLNRKIITVEKEPLMRAIWSYYIINPWIARWSYNTSVITINKILGILPAGIIKHKLSISYKDNKIIKKIPKES